MKDMSTISKGNRKTIVVRGTGVGLIFNGGFVERVAANGASIGANIPAPHSYGIPLFDFEPNWSRFWLKDKFISETYESKGRRSRELEGTIS